MNVTSQKCIIKNMTPSQNDNNIQGYNMEDLRRLQLERARRYNNERYRYYEPSGKGEEFINAVANMDTFMTLYSAGNGIGKTATGANIVANICFPSDNKWFQHEMFKKFPYPKRGRIVSDPTNIEKNIIPQLKFWFPEEDVWYDTRKANKSYESIFTTKTGHEFDLMTYEQSPREFEGVTLGWAWLDEPPPQAILKAIISRMRQGGIIFITATPLAGSAYLYDMFAKGETQIEITNPDTGAKIMYVRQNAYIEADVESACKEHGVRGHLKHEDIMKMMAEYSEDERQARIYGKFQHLVGMVFKKWNRQVHVIKPFNVNHRDYSVWEMLDPHPRNPDAVLWVAMDKYGTKYVVDELYKSVESDEELAEKIKNKASQYRVVKRIADPSAFNVNQHDENGQSLADRLSKHGLTYQKGTKQRTQADRRIQEALNYTEVNGHMVKAPEFYVFDHCERLIFEMEHYRWDEWTGKMADKRDRKEKPVDKDDHMIEDLGRCLIQEPAFEPYVVRVDAPAQAPSYDPYA